MVAMNCFMALKLQKGDKKNYDTKCSKSLIKKTNFNAILIKIKRENC